MRRASAARACGLVAKMGEGLFNGRGHFASGRLHATPSPRPDPPHREGRRDGVAHRGWKASPCPSGVSREDATRCATILAGPIAILLTSTIVDLVLTTVVAVLFILLVLALWGLEERANARGESVFHPRRPNGWSYRRCPPVEMDPKSLRGVDIEGRARLCRDVAARCLEGAARHGRLEGRLRREAAGWIFQMYKEMRR